MWIRLSEAPEDQSEGDGEAEQNVEDCPIEDEGREDIERGEFSAPITEAGQVVQFPVIAARATQSDAERAGESGFRPAGIGRRVLAGIAQRGGPGGFGVVAAHDE